MLVKKIFTQPLAQSNCYKLVTKRQTLDFFCNKIIIIIYSINRQVTLI